MPFSAAFFTISTSLRRRSSSLPTLTYDKGQSQVTFSRRRSRVSFIKGLPIYGSMAEFQASGESSSPTAVNRRQLIVDSSGESANDYPCKLYLMDKESDGDKVILKVLDRRHAEFMRNVPDKDDPKTLWAQYDLEKTGLVILWNVDHDKLYRYFATPDAFQALRNSYHIVETNVLQKSQEDMSTAQEEPQHLQQERLENEEAVEEVATNESTVSDISDISEGENARILEETEARINPIKIGLRNGKSVASREISFEEKSRELSQMNSKLKIKFAKMEKENKTLSKENLEHKAKYTELHERWVSVERYNKQLRQCQDAQSDEHRHEIEAHNETRRESEEKDERLKLLEARVKELEHNATVSEAKNEEKEAKIQDLQKAVEEKDGQVGTLQLNIQIMQEDTEHLKEDKAELQTQKEILEEEAATAIRENNKLLEVKENYEKLIKENSDLKEQLQDEIRQKDQCARTGVVLQLKNEEQAKEIKTLINEKKRLEAKNERLDFNVNVYESHFFNDMQANQNQEEQHARQMEGNVDAQGYEGDQEDEVRGTYGQRQRQQVAQHDQQEERNFRRIDENKDDFGDRRRNEDRNEYVQQGPVQQQQQWNMPAQPQRQVSPVNYIFNPNTNQQFMPQIHNMQRQGSPLGQGYNINVQQQFMPQQQFDAAWNVNFQHAQPQLQNLLPQNNLFQGMQQQSNLMDVPRYGYVEVNNQNFQEQWPHQQGVNIAPTRVVQAVSPTNQVLQQPQQAQAQHQPQYHMVRDTTVKDLNDLDPFLIFRGKKDTRNVLTWFESIEDTFQADWDDLKKIRRALKHLDRENPAFKALRESNLTNYRVFKQIMTTAFNNQNPFDLSRWTEAKRYQDTNFVQWMSSQLGILLMEKTVPRWDEKSLTQDELAIIMNSLTRMIPKKSFVGFYRLDKSWNTEKLLAYKFLDLCHMFTEEEAMEDMEWTKFKKDLPVPDGSENYRMNSIPKYGSTKRGQRIPNFSYQRTNFNLAPISNTGRNSPPNRQPQQNREQGDRGGRFNRGRGDRSQYNNSPTQGSQQTTYQQQRQNPSRGGYQGYQQYQNDKNQQQQQNRDGDKEQVNQQNYSDGNRRSRPYYRRGRFRRGNRNNYRQRRVNLMEQNDDGEDYQGGEYEDFNSRDYNQYNTSEQANYQGQNQENEGKSHNPKNGQ